MVELQQFWCYIIIWVIILKDLKYQFLKRLQKQCVDTESYIIFEDFRQLWPKCPDLNTILKCVDVSLFKATEIHREDKSDAKLSLKLDGIEWVKNERARRISVASSIVAAIAAVAGVILTILFKFLP